MATIYNCEFLEVAKGYKYLPKRIMDLVELYRKKDNGELNTHPLIKEVNEFDNFYPYSDSIEVWRGGKAREDELSQSIMTCDDFTSDEKDILIGGLSTNNDSINLFQRTFPYSQVLYEPHGLVDDILKGFFIDEHRIERIVNALQEFRDTIRDMDVVYLGGNRKPIDGYFIHSTQVYTPKQAYIKNKIAVADKYQNAVYDLYHKVTADDMKYYCKIASMITLTIPVPGKSYVRACTRLPELLNARVSEWFVEDEVLTRSIYANETREIEYYTLTYTIPGDKYNESTNFNFLIKP